MMVLAWVIQVSIKCCQIIMSLIFIIQRSGGGFFVQTGGVWSVCGIVSSSITSAPNFCPESKHSILTKIDSFLDWINRKSDDDYSTSTYESFQETRFVRTF